jgi:DNA-binding phage protein
VGLFTVRILELKDIVPLLRAEVRRAGGVTAWCKKTGVHRTIASKVLNNLSPPTKSVIKALKLRTVFVASDDKPKRPRRSR